MQEFIARENIKRFEARLRAGCDEQDRATIERLLDGERRRLRALLQDDIEQTILTPAPPVR